MRLATNRLMIALLALGLLVSCGGTGDETSLTARVAQAVSRSMVNVITQVEDRDETEARTAPSAEPLLLAASRPDSILMDELGAARSETPTTGHVVAPTIVSVTTMSMCSGSSYTTLGKPIREARASSTDCPLPMRPRAGNITRI